MFDGMLTIFRHTIPAAPVGAEQVARAGRPAQHAAQQQRDHDDGVQPQLRVRRRRVQPHGPQGGRQGQDSAGQVSDNRGGAYL